MLVKEAPGVINRIHSEVFTPLGTHIYLQLSRLATIYKQQIYLQQQYIFTPLWATVYR